MENENKNGSIVVRPVKPLDQAAAQELILCGLEEHWGVTDPSKNRDLENICGHYADAAFLVACDGERIVGTGALVTRTNDVAEIVRMSVAADMRRRGIGRMILQELCRRASDGGFRKIILETTATWSEAIEFYLAHGFRITHCEGADVYFALDIEQQTTGGSPARS